jgi:GT2 family glycosyltransferase
MVVNGVSCFLVLELLKSFGEEIHSLYKVIVAVDSHTPTEVTDSLIISPKVRLERFNEPFNFSKKCNLGAQCFSNYLIFFLNDDMLSLKTGWVTELQHQFSDPSVGGVGGLLLTPDGFVQCAGHANVPRPHMYGVGKDPRDPAFQQQLAVVRLTDGLSGACFAVRRSDFMEVGGMCKQLPSSYNSVDLGFK